jgi:hypothetical protein
MHLRKIKFVIPNGPVLRVPAKPLSYVLAGWTSDERGQDDNSPESATS